MEDNGKGLTRIRGTHRDRMKSIEQRIKHWRGADDSCSRQVLFRSNSRLQHQNQCYDQSFIGRRSHHVSNGLSVLLKKEKDIELVGAVETGLLALKTIREEQIDVLIMTEHARYERAGITERNWANHPEIRFLALSMHYDANTGIIELEARGYFRKMPTRKSYCCNSHRCFGDSR